MTIEQDLEIMGLRRQLEQSDNMCADILDMNIRLWRSNKVLTEALRNVNNASAKALRDAANSFHGMYTDSCPYVSIEHVLLGMANNLEKYNA